MNYLGDYNEDDTVYCLFNTFDTAGASVTRATDGTISVYKDNGTTQSTAGVTTSEDFDSLTGVHSVTIDTSADAFYATGADYAVVLSAATIDGNVVNAVIAHFSIENRTQKANVTKWSGTAVASPATAGYPAVTIKDGTGTGELDTSSGKVSLADGSIAAATFAAGAIDAAAVADGAIDAGAIATGAITAAKFAAGAIDAAALAADAATEIADALLKRDMSAVSGESARSLLNSIRKLMNKVSISGSTLTIYKEDDSTSAYTQTVSTSASAEPIVGLDTV